MFQKSTKIAILALLFCVLPDCVAPEAIKTEIQGIRNNIGKLERLIDQKVDNIVVAEQIDQINNRIEQTTQLAEELFVWRKNVEAETINYGGAGWVVVGTGVMAIIFIGAGLLLIRAFMQRGNSLALLTCAIQKIGKRSPGTIRTIKDQLEREVSEERFQEQDRQNLGKFARKHGTFVEQK